MQPNIRHFLAAIAASAAMTAGIAQAQASAPSVAPAASAAAVSPQARLTLRDIYDRMEAAGYRDTADRQAFIEALEAITTMPAGNEHPQGDKLFNGKTHQVFGHQYISRVESGGRLAVVHTTSIEDGLYPDEVDYTTMSF